MADPLHLFAALALLLSGCGDNLTSTTDAAPSCCDFLPDQDAVRACAVESLPPGGCGVVACPTTDGFVRINVCNGTTDGGAS